MRNREKTRPGCGSCPQPGLFCAKQPLTERGGGGMLRTVPAARLAAAGWKGWNKMAKQITAIIVGAGHRALLYSTYALENPQALKIVGVADPDPIRRRKTAEMHGFGEDMCFESAEALAERPRLADAVINGTMDTQHVKTAVPLLRRGYDMLLEKPFAVNEDEMWERSASPARPAAG